MKMELIQPFISALDAVLADTLQSPVSISDLEMEEEGYRKKGFAAMITIKGEIEGRLILDMDSHAAAKIASALAGEKIEESDPAIRETVCELANMVIGNAVTLLNDRGFTFKVFPPAVHTEEQLSAAGAETEAMVLSFETPHGFVHMNISMRYHRRRTRERTAVVVR
ncbi:MAG: chemotaxis protein CheX [Candidatus Acidiferrales bacterium]